jgi:Uma2 family endonuclease
MAYFSVASTFQRPNARVPPLENGDRLDQKTFHERYESMEDHVRAELIGGIVYMASPQKLPHSRTTKVVGHWLTVYEGDTPGTESFPELTSILGPDSEPQPDHCLIILPEYGGQTRVNKKRYLVGAPELIVETAETTESRDLHQKKGDYENAGVREYVVIALRSQQVFWFKLRGRKFADTRAGSDGVFRSGVFPGLWLDAAAILRGDRKRVLEVVRAGLVTPEHQAFVQKLGKARGE